MVVKQIIRCWPPLRLLRAGQLYAAWVPGESRPGI